MRLLARLTYFLQFLWSSLDFHGIKAPVADGNFDLSGFRAAIIEIHSALAPPSEIKQIFQLCVDSGLAPRVDLFGGTVVAFERVT